MLKENVSRSVLSDAFLPPNCSLPGTSDHVILQARILEWVARRLPSPGDLPDPAIKPASPALQADSLSSEPPGKPDQRKDVSNFRGPGLHLL